MNFDNDLVVGKLRRWEKYLAAYRLPEWDAIPDFGLYMEQVVQFLKQYLDYLPPELRQTEPITAAAINNYVRTKLLPEPRKKRYYRIHIAYLIMILTMKQSLSISDVQKILPQDSSEANVRAVYEDYSLKFRRVGLFFNQQVQSGAEGIRTATEQSCDNAVELLVIESALIAGFSKILAEKLIRLCGADPEDVLAAEAPRQQE